MPSSFFPQDNAGAWCVLIRGGLISFVVQCAGCARVHWYSARLVCRNGGMHFTPTSRVIACLHAQ